MEFRDLKRQYEYVKKDMDLRMREVIGRADFIQGEQVAELERRLAAYVGAKHCVACANGTDALQLALMAWGVGEGDAVFVPDFTFFSSGEVASAVKAEPVFVDVEPDTYNMDCAALEAMARRVAWEGRLRPKAVVAVDLFGQPADHGRIREIAKRHGMLVLEDAAQGFGGRIGERRAGSFGDISATSFFPAKPLGCYGDGGAVFTDNGEWAELIRSYCVHGRGASKYDNVRIGMNSRLDTLQAAVLLAKLPVFCEKELGWAQAAAGKYTERLGGAATPPFVREGFHSSWAQYTIRLSCKEERDGLQAHLKGLGIPSAVYYQKPMHQQEAFLGNGYDDRDYPVTNSLTRTVLSLPFHPYMEEGEIALVADAVRGYLKG